MAEVLTQEQIQAAEAAGASRADLTSIFNLKEQAARFADAFRNLLSWESAVAGTDLEPEYRKLVSSGKSVRDKVAAVMNSIDSMISTVSSWFKKIVSYIPGLGAMPRYQRPSPQTLGIVWFIPAAAIAGALALIGFWLADYAKFAKRFGEQQRIAAELQAQGVPPIEANRQAGATVAGTAPGFLADLGSLSSILILGAVVGGGFYLWKKQRPRRRRR